MSPRARPVLAALVVVALAVWIVSFLSDDGQSGPRSDLRGAPEQSASRDPIDLDAAGLAEIARSEGGSLGPEVAEKPAPHRILGQVIGPVGEAVAAMISGETSTLPELFSVAAHLAHSRPG